jgi:hypothetical protein
LKALPKFQILTASQHIPTPRALSEYDNREFADEEITFSSFTYLIDSVRIAGSLLTINNNESGPGERALEAAEAKFVNWFLYLPKCKADIVKVGGEIDETMFWAHNITNWYVASPESCTQPSA